MRGDEKGEESDSKRGRKEAQHLYSLYTSQVWQVGYNSLKRGAPAAWASIRYL